MMLSFLEKGALVIDDCEIWHSKSSRKKIVEWYVSTNRVWWFTVEFPESFLSSTEGILSNGVGILSIA